jgi:hypothetical protein
MERVRILQSIVITISNGVYRAGEHESSNGSSNVSGNSEVHAGLTP